MAREYWFARRFPLSDARRSLAPVNRKGLGVAYVFILGMLTGGIAFLILGMLGQVLLGWIVFALVALASAYYFISTAAGHGDQKHTVADYKAGRVPGQAPYLK